MGLTREIRRSSVLGLRSDLKRFLADESGATAVEYAVLAGTLGIVLVTALNALGTKIYDLLDGVVGKVASVTN